MAKKINIKNLKLGKSVDLAGLKDQLAKKGAKKEEEKKAKKKTLEKPSSKKATAKKAPIKKADKIEEVSTEAEVVEKPRVRARKRSVFAEKSEEQQNQPEAIKEIEQEDQEKEETVSSETEKAKEPQKETIAQQPIEQILPSSEKPATTEKDRLKDEHDEHIEEAKTKEPSKEIAPPKETVAPTNKTTEHVALGPTGRHIKDILPKKKEKKPATEKKPLKQPKQVSEHPSSDHKRGTRFAKYKDFHDLKPSKRSASRSFDSRDRQGLREGDEESRRWRKKRPAKKSTEKTEELTVRPTELSVRLPIQIKELAAAMKLKASELIQKLFMQGVIVTLNDALDDETTVQLLGQEFGCEISIDTSEEERIRITSNTIKEEIQQTPPEKLKPRPPVVAFMGHVDHGKTSLIDYIRKSNITSGEAGAITQHIGAFLCHTDVGDLTILDTPGHEAFSAMRARGAEATDIVVLVVAGDEGIRQQTEEAIQHAQAAGVTIVIAINKCDKPNFNAENVYRQLADINLLPEAWGGQTITVNTSAQTGEGVTTLLEMLALQAEVLELKANPDTRARGTVLESEMHKGLGAVATVLVQNGTLHPGDTIICDYHYGRIKTMRDHAGKDLKAAPPSTPVRITGLSSVPQAGEEFVVLQNEKEAKEIAEARLIEIRKRELNQKRAVSLDSLLQEAEGKEKKVLKIVLRGDVQGSIEALKTSLARISSDKVEVEVIFSGVGEISESDVQLAAASNAIILGFHTGIESHAEPLIKQYGVQVKLHDIIYHAIDEVRNLMAGTLDKIEQEVDKGKAIVKAVFKSSKAGAIAGCLVTEGVIHRNHRIRVVRDGEVIHKGPIESLRRVNDDVREVQKGLECGIVLRDTNDIKEGDVLEAYEVTYISQEL